LLKTAEFETNLRRERRMEGIAKAKAVGVAAFTSINKHPDAV
jgi:DNA invertase Pin-like site-specific DNA recombinase